MLVTAEFTSVSRPTLFEFGVTQQLVMQQAQCSHTAQMLCACIACEELLTGYAGARDS